MEFLWDADIFSHKYIMVTENDAVIHKIIYLAFIYISIMIVFGFSINNP